MSNVEGMGSSGQVGVFKPGSDLLRSEGELGENEEVGGASRL